MKATAAQEWRIGDHVTWTSQSSGSVTTKAGMVVMTKDAAREQMNQETAPRHVASELFPEHRRMFDGWAWESAKGGVLVEVRDGKTSRAKPKLYMPKLSQLQAANSPATN